MNSYVVVSYAATNLPEAYRSLVYAKWLYSLRYGNDYFKLSKADSYYAAYNAYITSILAKPETVVRLALLADDRDVCLGFAVYRGNILDYVHVHRDNRRVGIARALVPPSIDTVTHLTKTGLSIFGKTNWAFDPFA